jgi:hypothetical protein
VTGRSTAPWDTDSEVIVRVLRRRWWDEVHDLLGQSSADTLAFDELELDDDRAELERAVGVRKVALFAARALGDAGEEGDGDPALRALEAPPAEGRAFLRLLGANLAFALRSDELLAALVRAVKGPPPRIAPDTLGALLGRARSARWARETLGALEEPARTRALEAVRPAVRGGDFAVLHAVATAESLGGAIGRTLSHEGLALVEWGVRRTKERDSADERYLVTRPSGGWVTVIARGGISRERAQSISRAAPALGRVVSAERSGERARFAIFEGGRATLDEEKLRERLGSLELDDVAGELRALGISIHDPASNAGATSLVFEDYVAEGRSSSPARLRRLGVEGFAFSKKS